MDTLNTYRQIIETVFREYASIPYAHGDIRTEIVLDRDNDHYLLMNVGWRDDSRIHGALVHIDIINDKLWIQRDGTEEGVAIDLVRAGVPKDHIVLAFKPPEIRPYTDFAVD